MAVLQPPGAPFPPVAEPVLSTGLVPPPPGTEVTGVGVPTGPEGPPAALAEGPVPGQAPYVPTPYDQPLQFPPEHWFAKPEGTMPSVFQSPGLGDAAQLQAPGEIRQEAGLSEEQQAGKMGPPQTKEAVAPGKNAPGAALPPAGKNASPADIWQKAEQEQNEAYLMEVAAQKKLQDAERAKNLVASSEGVALAEKTDRDITTANAAYMKANVEAKEKRAVLEKEAIDLANTKIDPDRAWHNMSFGQQLGVILLAALNGATARAVKTGKNVVMEQIDDMIMRDMKAQEANLSTRFNVLGIRRGMLADEVQQGRDMLDFQYKAAMTGYTIAENKIKAMLLEYDNDVITAKGEAYLAQLQQKKGMISYGFEAAKRADLYQREQDQIKNAQAWAQIGLARDAANARSAKQPSDLGERKFENEKEWKERGARIHLAKYRDDSGMQGQVLGPNDTVAADVNMSLASATSFVQGVRRLKQIRKENGWKPFGSWGNDAQKEANTIFEGLLSDFSRINHQGTVREGEYPRYEKMFGSIGGLIDPTANLDALENRAIQQANNELQGRVGPEVAYWQPQEAPEGSKFFNPGSVPKKQPGAAGLP